MAVRREQNSKNNSVSCNLHENVACKCATCRAGDIREDHLGRPRKPVLSRAKMSSSSKTSHGPGIEDSNSDSDLRAAEAFIDAFYAWDANALSEAIHGAENAKRALYYQGWAEAGNYQILKRRQCTRVDEGWIECSITVSDDIGEALGYVATDVFRLWVANGRIHRVEFEGDDPAIFNGVLEWMASDRPEVFTGPCKDFFDGGETPAACVRAVVEAARDFVKRSKKA